MKPAAESLNAALRAALELTFLATDTVALCMADPGHEAVAAIRVGPPFDPGPDYR